MPSALPAICTDAQGMSGGGRRREGSRQVCQGRQGGGPARRSSSRCGTRSRPCRGRRRCSRRAAPRHQACREQATGLRASEGRRKRRRMQLADSTCAFRAIVWSHSSSEQDCMCAQKDSKTNSFGQLAIASRRRSSVRRRSSPSMRAISAQNVGSEKTEVQGARMSAGAGGRSAGTGSVAFYSRPSFPNTLRFFRAFPNTSHFFRTGLPVIDLTI